jgi:DNA-binding SARP family transcriptional activator
VYELLTLGGLDLWDGARDSHPLLAQPKRIALLVYLALARPRVHRRSTLLGVFWPELRAEQGRNALRQALHGLRRSLGASAIRARGDEEIRLDLSLFRCDVIEFEAALAAGRMAEAVELYEGPLLPGFFVDGASGFERWLEDERARLQGLAVNAAWRLMADAEAAGDPTTAVVWARLAVHHSDHDELSYRRLIGLLTRVGDRGGAVATYLQLCRRLAQDFGCAPSPETEALLRTIRAPERGVRRPPLRPRSVTRR